MRTILDASRAAQPLFLVFERLLRHDYFTSMNFLDSLLGAAQRPRQTDLRQIVSIERGDQIVVGGRDRFLRLHHFDVVRHAGREPVPRLHQRLIGQIQIILRHGHLIGCGANVQKRRANLVIDLAREIGQFILSLLERRLSLDDVAADAPAIEHIDLGRGHDRECAVRAGKGGTDVAVIGGDVAVG